MNQPTASACSALNIMLGDTPMMVRSYDWRIGNALVMINQRDMSKRALSFDNPANWTSKYGSVTINQYGRELPCDGINEAGLAIACLWLDASEYPTSDDRPSVNTAQWIQYQLDTAATVSEVIESNKRIRITPYGGARLHYFVSDAAGDCAVIEFLDGRMLVHHGDSLPRRLITNNTYSASNEYLVSIDGFGGDQPLPSGTNSLSRYARLASIAENIPEATQPKHLTALAIIQQVQQPSTRWQITYDLAARRMYFRTDQNQSVRSIDLAECDFAATNPVRVLDLQAPLEGNVLSEFTDYSREANRRLIEQSFAGTDFVQRLPRAVLNLAIEYPEFHCRPAVQPVAASE